LIVGGENEDWQTGESHRSDLMFESQYN